MVCTASYSPHHRIFSLLGFGHATRVSEFARHLLSLQESHTVYIISSAPKHVFSTAIALGAIYRSVEIDPVILQPLASVVSRITGSDIISNISRAPRYHVDRQK